MQNRPVSENFQHKQEHAVHGRGPSFVQQVGHSQKTLVTPPKYPQLNSLSHHSNAIDIRTEVDTLRNDFNTRFKQIIFTSVINAYYSAFMPCAFANKHLYFSKFWVSQHLFFTFVSLFTMCATYCLPIRYCDVLHRSAIHLGQWTKLNPRATHPPPQNWSKVSWNFWGWGMDLRVKMNQF
jgi:hypothetical protein